MRSLSKGGKSRIDLADRTGVSETLEQQSEAGEAAFQNSNRLLNGRLGARSIGRIDEHCA